jgi:hypothetical protein
MRTVQAGAFLLLAAAGAACGESRGPAATGPGPVSPDFTALSPEQQRLLASPVSAEAAAGRVATSQDLEQVRGWFAPGELEALLATTNRRAAARGEDTLPHCIPLCGYPAAQER